MADLICPFGATLARDDFGCPNADKVIRRGGTEIACKAPDAHARCSELMQHVKDAVLPAMDLEDDLLQIPHGILQKLQFGGLLGVARLCGNRPDSTTVEDIDRLVQAAAEKFGGLDALPCGELVDDVMQYRLPRRRSRK